MNRRKALKIAAGAVIGGGAGIFAISNSFKPDQQPIEEPRKLEFKNSETVWGYSLLDPDGTAEIAYSYYENGGCMYAVFKSIISQLADKYGEPYASFPVHMMKYGHGGIGGFGTVCGALNGASAAIGLLITDKAAQDILITVLYRWYENAELPQFSPAKAVYEFAPQASVSKSPLCHASITKWVKVSGYDVNSDERKERCRRLTSDVVKYTTDSLNKYLSNSYVTEGHSDETVGKCMTCHSDKGKLNNTSGKMVCNSCHSESLGHKIFANVHHKLMKSK